ncbi:hypothetical protein [Nitrospira sp. BLG_2]|uniref:hypothetical protein n=1 Tax=Nitrospira sp. BLG_2 TaxID=3397507 RepID=UPI003B9A71DA
MQQGEVALGVQQEEVVPEMSLGEVVLSVNRAVADKRPAGEARAGRAARRRKQT